VISSNKTDSNYLVLKVSYSHIDTDLSQVTVGRSSNCHEVKTWHAWGPRVLPSATNSHGHSSFKFLLISISRAQLLDQRSELQWGEHHVPGMTTAHDNKICSGKEPFPGFLHHWIKMILLFLEGSFYRCRFQIIFSLHGKSLPAWNPNSVSSRQILDLIHRTCIFYAPLIYSGPFLFRIDVAHQFVRWVRWLKHRTHEYKIEGPDSLTKGDASLVPRSLSWTEVISRFHMIAKVFWEVMIVQLWSISNLVLFKSMNCDSIINCSARCDLPGVNMRTGLAVARRDAQQGQLKGVQFIVTLKINENCSKDWKGIYLDDEPSAIVRKTTDVKTIQVTITMPLQMKGMNVGSW